MYVFIIYSRVSLLRSIFLPERSRWTSLDYRALRYLRRVDPTKRILGISRVAPEERKRLSESPLVEFLIVIDLVDLE